MTTLHLIRHGETVWHRENRYAGSSDIALTDRGRAQARALAAWSASAGLDVVATSDLQRAEQTARVVADSAGVDLLIEPALREVDFGRAEGMTRPEMRESFPVELAAFLTAPASSPLPGGELGAVAAARGLRAIESIRDDHGDDAIVAVVAHTTIIRLLLCQVLAIPLDDYRRRFPRLDNTTITTLALPPAHLAQPGGGGALIRYNAAAVTGGTPG